MADVWANSMACQPRATYHIAGCCQWWIHCYDSRATCHIAGCSHLAKSMSWSCHIVGCKNSIRHIESRLLSYFYYYFNAVWAVTSGGFRIASDRLVSWSTATNAVAAKTTEWLQRTHFSSFISSRAASVHSHALLTIFSEINRFSLQQQHHHIKCQT